MDTQDKINVGASSSLIELKAELNRKRRDLEEQRSAKGVPKSVSKSKEKSLQNLLLKEKKNAGVDRRSAADLEQHEKEKMTEEKSRAVLEAKAKLYEKMTTEALDYDEQEHPVLANSLVNFQQKAIEKYQARKRGKGDEKDEDWVEFIDTLGRTRRCHKSELAQAIANDEELASREKEKFETCEISFGKEINSKGSNSSSGGAGGNNSVDGKSIGSYSTVPPPTTLNLTKTLTEEQVKEMSHRKWEEEQDLAEAKDYVHYQDVLYDEVRTHGVAYFGFASDDSKRAEQIRDLKKLSEQTEATRERVTKERDQKASQLKERLRKVRDRKRARLGLPPKKDETESEEQLSPSQSDRSDVSSGKKPKVSDEDDNEEEEEERRRSGDTGGAGGGSDSKSKAEMRPWDFGKPGVYGPKPINFDQLDATWLKDRREDRSSEFAPPTTYYTKTKLAGPTSTVTSLGFGGSSSSRSSSSGYNYSNFVREKSRVETGMKEEKKTGFSPNTGYRGGGMSLESQNLPGKKRNVIGRKDDDDDDDDDDEELKDPHYGGTSSINQYSSDERALSGRGVRAQSPIPIKDELLPADDPTKRRGGESCSWKGGKGAEIPPPPTFEYYHGEGGSGGKGRGQKSGALPGDDSVKDAISAGLRALREQFEMKQTAKGGPDVPGSDSGY